jgi:hypothetical protein
VTHIKWKPLQLEFVACQDALQLVIGTQTKAIGKGGENDFDVRIVPLGDTAGRVLAAAPAGTPQRTSASNLRLRIATSPS